MFYNLVFIFFGFILSSINAQCPICTLATSECYVPSFSSETGVLCEECNFRGFRLDADSLCICSSSSFDPQLNCLIPNEGAQESVNIDLVRKRAYCEPHASFEYGFWRNTPSSELELWILDSSLEGKFMYGASRNPPVSDRCFSDLYGPKPNRLTAYREEFKVNACNQFGGVDPNQEFLEIFEEYEG